MTFVKIIADDLTGALDSAAPFATPEAPVRLLFDGRGTVEDAAALGGVTTSSESREMKGAQSQYAIDAAIAAVQAVGVPAGRSTLFFAKVDSVLRGRPIDETLRKHALWNTQACLFAPAFPKMGRRTVDGFHQVLAEGAWRPAVVHDIRAAFRQAGANATLRRADDPVQAGAPALVVGDASTDAELLDHVRALQPVGRVLWAGSRGLAEALGAGNPAQPMPAITTIVNGTSHGATRAQLDVLAARAGCPRLVDPVPQSETAALTRERVRAAAWALDPARERALVVIGGDTLACVLPVFGPDAVLDCIGEVSPGVPISRVRGGPFDGLALATKSGGFGGATLLADLLGSVATDV